MCVVLHLCVSCVRVFAHACVIVCAAHTSVKPAQTAVRHTHSVPPRAAQVQSDRWESGRDKTRRKKSCSSPFVFTLLLKAGAFGVEDRNPVLPNLHSGDTDLGPCGALLLPLPQWRSRSSPPPPTLRLRTHPSVLPPLFTMVTGASALNFPKSSLGREPKEVCSMSCQ